MIFHNHHSWGTPVTPPRGKGRCWGTAEPPLASIREEMPHPQMLPPGCVSRFSPLPKGQRSLERLRVDLKQVDVLQQAADISTALPKEVGVQQIYPSSLG